MAAFTTADASERLAKRQAAKQLGVSAGIGSGVKVKIKKPNLVQSAVKALGSVYDAAKNQPGAQLSSPVNTGAGVSMGGQQNAVQNVVEPVRAAGRRAVGDLTAIPGVGKPSASPTAADFRAGNYVAPIVDYVTLASTLAPGVAKGLKTTQNRPFLGVVVQEKPASVRLPRNTLKSNERVKMISIGDGRTAPVGGTTLRTYDPSTGQINGYAEILFNRDSPAEVVSLFSNSPSAATQLVSSAQRISKDLLPDLQYPLIPSSDLSVHSYPFVQRLQQAGLIDPQFTLPEIDDLNLFSRADMNMESFMPASTEIEKIIEPSLYAQDYQELLRALASAQKNRQSRPPTSAQLKQIVEKRGPRQSGTNYWIDDLMEEAWHDEIISQRANEIVDEFDVPLDEALIMAEVEMDFRDSALRMGVERFGLTGQNLQNYRNLIRNGTIKQIRESQPELDRMFLNMAEMSGFGE